MILIVSQYKTKETFMDFISECQRKRSHISNRNITSSVSFNSISPAQFHFVHVRLQDFPVALLPCNMALNDNDYYYYHPCNGFLLNNSVISSQNQ